MNTAVAQLRSDVDPLATLDPVLLHTLTQHAHEMVSIVDMNGQVLFSGGTVRTLLGYEPEERVGQHVMQLVHPDDADYARMRTRDFIEDPNLASQSGTISVRLRHRNGEYRHVEIVATRLIRRGSPALMVVHTRDVTAETRALERSARDELRLETALWGGEVFIWQLDTRTGQLTTLGEAAFESRGIDCCLGPDHSTRWMEQIHPDDAAPLQVEYERQDRGETSSFELAYRVRTRSGEWSWVLERSRIIDRNADGTAHLISGACVSIDATRRLQRQLDDASQRLRLAVAAGNLGPWEWNVATGIVSVSPEWLAMLGRTSDAGDQWQSRPCSLVHGTHEDDMPIVLEAIRGLLEDGRQDLEYEVRRPHSNGEWRWLRCRGTVVERSADGWPVRVVGVTQDVHERRLAEDTLRASERRHRVASRVHGGYLAETVVSHDGRLRSEWVSDGFESIFGVSVQQFRDLGGWPRFTHPEDRNITIERLRKLEPGVATPIELRIVLLDGRVRRLRSVHQLSIDAAAGMRRVFSSVTDITDLEKEFQVAADLQADIIENVPACIVLLDPELRVRFASRGLLGRDAAHMRGTPLLDYFGTDWHEQIRAGLLRCATEERNVEIEGVAPADPQSADQRYRLHIALARGRDLANRWCVVIRDISNALRDQSQAFQSIGVDLQRAGHDLREGVGQQLTGAALLLQSLSVDLAHDGSRHAADVARIATLLNHSVDDVRALSRSLSPVGVSSAGLPAALQGLADHAAAVARVVAVCTVDIDPACTLSGVDADHLFGIAQEAVTNATRHAQAEHLTLRLAVTPSRVELEISDDGRGIGEVSSSVGLTRGLALMTHRARAIGATLSVSRREGGGTSVRCLKLSS